MEYNEFLESKKRKHIDCGFNPDISSFPAEMFDFQRDVVEWACKKGRCALFLGTGLGKCHGKGTKILMFDGSIKNVEDVKVGDQLMGPDSKPRNVLSLARGVDEMFRISPVKGESWECNNSHVLSLKITADKNRYVKNEIVNIPLDEYLESNKTFKHISKLWRTGVDFNFSSVDFDPYILGVWLGDGSKHTPCITNSDREVISEIENFASSNNLYIRYENGNNTTMHHLSSPIRGRANKGCNQLKNLIKTCIINDEKRIPRDYIINSREIRLQLLAGLLDTDGYLIDNVYEILTKYDGLKDDILFLARSLGFAAYSSVKIGEIKSIGFKGAYHRIFISGNINQIPCRVERKIAFQRKQKKDVLKTGFSVIPLGKGDYYGFELDGDHLYLLGDFTVTHNTICQLTWADQVVRHTGRPVLILAPLAVASQTAREGEKFHIRVNVCRRQEDVTQGINITNYEMLEHFDVSKFSGIVLDESSILKSFSGKVRTQLVESFKNTPYRLACTATPAPNDHIELTNHSDFLGVMKGSEVLSMFFTRGSDNVGDWMVKPHAQKAFWEWVASWAVMMQNPRDLGYNGDLFDLPPLNIVSHVVTPKHSRFQGRGVARGLNDRREARRESIEERIQKCADIVNSSDESWVIWCGLNAESAELKKRINGAVEVTGSDKPEHKESRILGFSDGSIRILVTKSEICGFGINMQVCHNMAFVGLSDCYDEETEILTLRGWLKFSDVIKSDMVATINPETLIMEWQHPIRIIYEPYTGEMIHFNGEKNFDLMVTPNHKVFVDRCKMRHPSDMTWWHLDYAENIRDNFKRQEFRMRSCPVDFAGLELTTKDIPIPEGMRISTRSVIISKIEPENLIRLIGWYVTEGYCRPLNSQEAGRIVISQTDYNPENRTEIIKLLNDIGLHVNDKTKDITGYSYNLASFLLNECGTSSKDMRLPSWIKNISKPQLELLRDTMLKGDGSHAGGIPRFLRTACKQLADDFQEICLKTGIRASVKYRGSTNKDYPDSKAWDVILAWNNVQPGIHKPPKTVQYSGMIGCVEVPNHVILVRRNGVPVISGNSFEQYYQAVRRCWRFGQTEQVNVHIITSEAEGAVVANIKEKERKFKEMLSGMIAATQEINTREIHDHEITKAEYKTRIEEGKNWKLYLGDNVEHIKQIEDNSIGFSIFSPPFSSLFTYSNSPRDMGNCKGDDEFYNHFMFLAPELLRVLMPGRNMAVHCMQLPSSLCHEGYIGLRDFRGDLIRIFQSVGFIYHSEICVWKDPVQEMYRTKSIGLLHKQLKKDSAMSRQGKADYILVFRKPGENTKPISHDDIPVPEWQQLASPVWMNINQMDVLQARACRDEEDEKHICPLQLDLIENCLKLWSAPGDLVLDPFAGIGSSAFKAILMGRKAVGIELKESYYVQAVKNCKRAESELKSPQVKLDEWIENKDKQTTLEV